MSGAVLVTGGAGYVGSHAVAALLAAGRPVVVLDDLSTGHADALPPVGGARATLVVGRVEDADLVARLARDHRVGAVLHFAARTSVAESMGDPDGYHRANVGATRTLAGAAAAAGVAHVVFSSSAAVYGAPVTVPIPEDHPLAPVNPYGATKAEAEARLAATGLRVASLRYFNAAGAEPDLGLGERHAVETHLVPLAVAAALGGPPLTVHGEDWPTPDGTCVRDYVHVVDLAAGHLAALGWLERGGATRAWNLGTGRGASVREVLDAVGRAVGRPVPWRPGPRRPGDPPVLVADPARAARELGWRATARSGLDRLVADAVAFARRGR